MPVHAPIIKVKLTERTGANVILQGNTFDEANEFARALSKKKRTLYVHPFDDARVIAGQGTIGLEILDQLPDCQAVVVPIGGGGLISGVACAIKSTRPDIFILGVKSEWSVSHQVRKQKDKPLLPPVSIADGIAVKRVGEITAAMIDKYVDKVVTVSENEIADAIVRYLETEKSVVEGAGAAALAGVLSGHLPKQYKEVVVLACGGNIDINVLARLIERDMGHRDRLLRLAISVPDRPGTLHTISGLIAKTGANVLHVSHDRSFSEEPANVDVSFTVEVRDEKHKQQILKQLQNAGLSVGIS